MKKYVPIAIAIVVILIVASISSPFFHKTNAQLTEQGSRCNVTYLINSNRVFCFRGNWDPSNIPAIQKASFNTGVEIITGPGTLGQNQMVAVYIEDVSDDLGFFWENTGLFK